MHFVYIIQSLKDGICYVGMSQNVDNRLAAHNSGKVFSTRSRRPFLLIYKESYSLLIKARNREKYLKSYKGVSEKRKIIEKWGVAKR